MSSAAFSMIMASAGSPGPLSATMTTQGNSGTAWGYSSPTNLNIGAVTSITFPIPPFTILGIWDDTSVNLIKVSFSDPRGQMSAVPLTQFVMNGRTFTFASASTIGIGSTQPIWTWANGGTKVTGSGIAFAFS